MVGTKGFEPLTSPIQGEPSTRLTIRSDVNKKLVGAVGLEPTYTEVKVLELKPTCRRTYILTKFQRANGRGRTVRTFVWQNQNLLTYHLSIPLQKQLYQKLSNTPKYREGLVSEALLFCFKCYGLFKS
jgi:hypothetical protein